MKVVVVGAGAAGLMAARDLVANGAEVILVESLNRIGGRIHTQNLLGFTNHLEAGAEFIHGNLPLTLKLMKQSGLVYTPTSGKFYQSINGKLQGSFEESKSWEVFYKAMGALKEDCTVSELLNYQFKAKKYEKLRREISDRAQGLDLADISRLSVFGIRKEWANEETQFRPDSGYSELLQWIYNQTVSPNFKLFLNQKVEKIEWSHKQTTVVTAFESFHADVVLLTLPPVFYKDISFSPQIQESISLFETIGFGEVIKFALEFEWPFWENECPDLGFLFADEGFTFWTQHPKRSPLLTGWLGNDYAGKYEKISDEKLLQLALSNLGKAFHSKFPVNDLYRTGTVFRHTKNSISRGGYSWPTSQTRKAVKNLQKGIDGTIWFAGEALHLGKGAATVEAAFQSGKKAAAAIIKSFK